MEREMVRHAIHDLQERLPESVYEGGDYYAQLMVERLEASLDEQLGASEFVFAVELGEIVGIVSLGAGAAFLYTVTGRPLRLTRELLHLGGAVVRESWRIGDVDTERVSFELRDRRIFEVSASLTGQELRRIRVELETLALRGSD